VRSLVLDTSVAIAWYLPETFRSAARAWQSQLLDGRVRLVVPGLHYWEFGDVLRTCVMRSELERDLAEELAGIEADWAANAEEIEELDIPLEKGDVTIDEVAVVWMPVG